MPRSRASVRDGGRTVPARRRPCWMADRSCCCSCPERPRRPDRSRATRRSEGKPTASELVCSDNSELDPDTHQLYGEAGVMSAVNSATAAVAAPLLTPWMQGPVDPGEAPVVVRVQGLLVQRRRHVRVLAVE